jgi:hypothetical protein
MPKFRKKPVVIEAEQWNPEALLWSEITYPKDVRPTNYLEVSTLLDTSGCSKEPPYWDWSVMAIVITKEGKHVVSPGDWIITGVQGEKYPCKPDIFAATYEPVDD